MTVAYLTELANSALPGKMLAPIVTPAFVKTNVMLNLMMVADLPPVGAGKVLSFPQKGSLTSETIAESTAYTLSANGELTDSQVDATAAKACVVSGPSAESERFGRQPISRFIEEQAAAIARFVDNDALSLFSGLSQSVTASQYVDTDILFDAQYAILSADCPDDTDELQFVTNARGVTQLRKAIVNSGASVWSNPAMLSILGGKPQANGYMGSIPGLCGIWKTSGHATSGSDTVQALIHPKWCLGAAIDSIPTVYVGQKISEGFYKEVGSLLFYDVLEVNDRAGCKVLSDI